jgi:hypothetical protein
MNCISNVVLASSAMIVTLMLLVASRLCIHDGRLTEALDERIPPRPYPELLSISEKP